MGIHRWPVDSHLKGSVTPKLFSFDDVTMNKGSVLPAVSIANSSYPIATYDPHRPRDIISKCVSTYIVETWPWPSYFVLKIALPSSSFRMVAPNNNIHNSPRFQLSLNKCHSHGITFRLVCHEILLVYFEESCRRNCEGNMSGFLVSTSVRW